MPGTEGKPIIIFGSTSMASLARHLLDADGHRRVVAFTVDQAYLAAPQFEGLPVVAFEEVAMRFAPEEHEMVVALGYSRINGLRSDRFEAAQRLGYTMASYVSRHAYAWSGLSLPEGCLIYEGAILQGFTQLALGVTVRAGANLGHHSTIGRHSFIASSVVTGGNVRIGCRVFVGLGAVIRDGVSIADRCLIGAGAVVISDTEPDGVYVGNPAHRLSRSAYEVTSHGS